MRYESFSGSTPIISGLYRITNIENSKVYIGQSGDIYSRWKAHISKELFAVGAAIHKYGVAAFNFEVLVICEKGEYLDYLEDACIQSFSTISPNGYNLAAGAGENPFASVESRNRHLLAVQSESNRTKISESMKVVCADKEFLNARSAAVTDALNKPETRAKISAKSKAMWESAEYRDNFTVSMRKVMDSDEYKAKISRTSKIHRNTPEALQRTSELSKAKWADPKHRIKVCFSRYPSKATPDFETGWKRCVSKGISEDFRKFAMDLCASRLHKLS